jgi:hypothetical protein
MSPYILSCMLAAALNPAQHSPPWECERAYVSMEQCKKAKLAVESKWTPVCYAPTAIAVEQRSCQTTDAFGTSYRLLWIGRDFVYRPDEFFDR